MLGLQIPVQAARYVFCQTLEWAELYTRMWRIWAVEIQRWMKAAENSTLFPSTAKASWRRGLQHASPGSQCVRSVGCAGLSQRWRLASSLGEGLVPLLLAGWTLPAVERAQPARWLWLTSRAGLAQPLHLRKAVWALGCYRHTGFSWSHPLLWRLVA